MQWMKLVGLFASMYLYLWTSLKNPPKRSFSIYSHEKKQYRLNSKHLLFKAHTLRSFLLPKGWLYPEHMVEGNFGQLSTSSRDSGWGSSQKPGVSVTCVRGETAVRSCQMTRLLIPTLPFGTTIFTSWWLCRSSLLTHVWASLKGLLGFFHWCPSHGDKNFKLSSNCIIQNTLKCHYEILIVSF